MGVGGSAVAVSGYRCNISVTATFGNLTHVSTIYIESDIHRYKTCVLPFLTVEVKSGPRRLWGLADGVARISYFGTPVFPVNCFHFVFLCCIWHS